VDIEYIKAGKHDYKCGCDMCFASRNFIPISEEYALSINPYLKTWEDQKSRFYYMCKMHDDITNRCIVHSIRPGLCSRFPFYEKGYFIGLYSSDCGYKKGLKKAV
jgi:Fe-S-cluster containining protein